MNIDKNNESKIILIRNNGTLDDYWYTAIGEF